jgi:hypothetical protein
MYIIGISDWNFISIEQETMLQWDSNKLWNEINKVTYNCNLNKAKMFPDYETADKIREEIIERKDEIAFVNDNVVGAILDEKNEKQFNVDKLRIYELLPVEIKRENE